MGMEIKNNFLKSYCLVVLDSKESLMDVLSHISETNVNFVTGKFLGGEKLVIATLKSTFNILEIEELLNMVIKSYIIFEMTPGFYGAKLEDQSYEEALFGKEINKLPFIQIQEALKELNNEIFDTFTDFSSKEFPMKSLEEELKEALDNEDYETAAKLRDKIKNK
jgi:hypothetical protein